MPPTAVKRKPRFNPVDAFAEFLDLKATGASFTTRANKVKDRLKGWLPEASEAYENDKGSLFYDFKETLTVWGKDYRGMELRKSTGFQFDEDVAESILKRKKVYDEALSTYVDQDKVYRLRAEGKLTDADIDKMFPEKEPTWSFYPVTGEVL